MYVQIDDKLWKKYEAAAGATKHPGGVEALIARQLYRLVDSAAAARVVILDREPLQQIETTLGGGSLRSPEDLVERIKAYASLTIGGIRLELSVAQKEEIAYRAEKLGKPPDEMLKAMIEQIETLLFHQGEAAFR